MSAYNLGSMSRPDQDTGWRPLRRPAHPARPSAFSRLAVAHALSIAGDTMVTVALAGTLFFDISPTAARGRVTLSLLFTMAPFAVVAPVLGPAIDRVRGGRRMMVFAAAAGRAVTCLAMAQVVDRLLLFPAAFSALVLSKTHAVAKSSLVPPAVKSEALLVEANSKLALTSGVVGFLVSGPAVGILQLAGAEWLLRSAAVVFAVTSVAALRLSAGGREEAAGRETAIEELHDAGIRLAAVAMAFMRGAVGFLTFLVAFGLRRDGAPSWWFGVVIAASALGSLTGAALAPRLRERKGEEPILATTLFVVATAGLLGSQFGGRLVTAVVAAVVGLAASAGKLAFDSLVQRDAPDAVQGRSFARFETVFQLTWVVGALVPVALSIRAQPGFAVLGIGGAMATAAYLTGRYRVTHHPSGAA